MRENRVITTQAKGFVCEQWIRTIEEPNKEISFFGRGLVREQFFLLGV